MNIKSIYNATPDPEITPEQAPAENPTPEIPAEDPTPFRSPETPTPERFPDESPMPAYSPEFPGTPAPSEIQRF
ncbi:MAG: hypothetical protein ACRYFA_12905 [Janthinobacterium lividum]